MKRIATTPALLLITALLIFAQCKKDKPKTPLEELPPETQTGANTFGCLVNGKVFKPGGAQFSGGSLQANYQNLGNGLGGDHLAIVARKQLSGKLFQIGLFADSLTITQGASYDLKLRNLGVPAASYIDDNSDFSLAKYRTVANIFTGNMHIKKLDFNNQIFSGTFWFKAVNSAGDTVNVTDGRFDVRYTR